MKAFALTSADQPASLIDLPIPDLAEDGVRIRVRAASVNGFDVFQANGYLFAYMEHVFPTIVGRDFAGVVEAVGAGRSDVAVGDQVLGFVPSTPPLHDGTYAEAISGSSGGLVLARKPAGLSFETAAAIPLVGATALGAIESADVRPGDVVLVVGATGGVGSFAVQLAAQRGATVIATAKPGEDEAFVRSLGAASTIDYLTGDVPAAVRALHPDGITVLIDAINRAETSAPFAELVRNGGRFASTMGGVDPDALAARDIRGTNVMGSPTPENLTWLADQVAAGTLHVEIQATYPLASAADALATFMAGTRGKIVLSVG